jgi:hypothetical protein
MLLQEAGRADDINTPHMRNDTSRLLRDAIVTSSRLVELIRGHPWQEQRLDRIALALADARAEAARFELPLDVVMPEIHRRLARVADGVADMLVQLASERRLYRPHRNPISGLARRSKVSGEIRRAV